MPRNELEHFAKESDIASLIDTHYQDTGLRSLAVISDASSNALQVATVNVSIEGPDPMNAYASATTPPCSVPIASDVPLHVSHSADTSELVHLNSAHDLKSAAFVEAWAMRHNDNLHVLEMTAHVRASDLPEQSKQRQMMSALGVQQYICASLEADEEQSIEAAAGGAFRPPAKPLPKAPTHKAPAKAPPRQPSKPLPPRPAGAPKAPAKALPAKPLPPRPAIKAAAAAKALPRKPLPPIPLSKPAAAKPQAPSKLAAGKLKPSKAAAVKPQAPSKAAAVKAVGKPAAVVSQPAASTTAVAKRTAVAKVATAGAEKLATVTSAAKEAGAIIRPAAQEFREVLGPVAKEAQQFLGPAAQATGRLVTSAAEVLGPVAVAVTPAMAEVAKEIIAERMKNWQATAVARRDSAQEWLEDAGGERIRNFRDRVQETASLAQAAPQLAEDYVAQQTAKLLARATALSPTAVGSGPSAGILVAELPGVQFPSRVAPAPVDFGAMAALNNLEKAGAITPRQMLIILRDGMSGSTLAGLSESALKNLLLASQSLASKSLAAPTTSVLPPALPSGSTENKALRDVVNYLIARQAKADQLTATGAVASAASDIDSEVDPIDEVLCDFICSANDYCDDQQQLLGADTDTPPEGDGEVVDIGYMCDEASGYAPLCVTLHCSRVYADKIGGEDLHIRGLYGALEEAHGLWCPHDTRNFEDTALSHVVEEISEPIDSYNVEHLYKVSAKWATSLVREVYSPSRQCSVHGVSCDLFQE